MKYEVQVWNISTDEKSHITALSFATIDEAMQYWSGITGKRAVMIDIARNVVFRRKGKWS